MSFVKTAVSLLALAAASATPVLAQSSPLDDPSWIRARAEMEARLAHQPRPQEARNVILFIADGMSVTTMTTSRIYEGQQRGELGVENLLSFERFPNSALVRTYTTDHQVPDSAGTATAMVTGIKTRSGAISVGPRQYYEACAEGAELPATLAELGEARGMATGVVSTARITHATPATLYAHSVSRSFEADSNLTPEAVEAGCVDIAAQLIGFDAGDGLELALGGGRAAFLPEDQGGARGDGRDLTQEWDGVYVEDAEGLRSLDPAGGEPVLGLFTNSHLSYEADRDDAEEPSLAEMTRFAIERLSQDEDGFVLMVEAGRVDHAHHGTNAYRAFNDMIAYSQAIQAAIEMVDLDETLIVVTADHGHVMSFAGYPAVGNDILGLVRRGDPFNPEAAPSLQFARDGKPYTAIGYHNGPNPRETDSPALTQDEVTAPDYRQQTAVPMGSETHDGADVALFATGPRAHYFSGSIEQNTIYHLIAHALGWDENAAE